MTTQIRQGAPTIRAVYEGPQDEVDRLRRAYGVEVIKRLEMGAVIAASSSQLEAVSEDAGVSFLAEDQRVFSTMATTVQSTGANLVWKALNGVGNFGGFTGRGIGIAIIDSGIGAHDDLAQRVAYARDFTGEGYGQDGYGHGTHVAGIIAGSGRGSKVGPDAMYLGMAPGASLIDLRVLGSDGTGYVSDVIEAIEFAVKHRRRFGIRVINMSLGHVPQGSYRDDPLARAVERATAAGIVVVASAGNFGKTEEGEAIVGAIVSPGYTPSALTVGALNTRGTAGRSDDLITTYSSRGPVGTADDMTSWEIKPDVVAPGNAIVSAGLTGSYLWNTFPDRQVYGANGGTYFQLSGSSMAAAVVSGAVAQMLQAEPSMTPADVKLVLQYTAEFIDGYGLIEQGAGSINVPLAIALAQARDFASAPVAVMIGDEEARANQWVLSQSLPRAAQRAIWEFSGTGERALANGLIWGNRAGTVDANGLIWGNRTGTVDANGLIWGNRTGTVDANGLIWGNRQGTVDANGLIWGNGLISLNQN